MESMIFNLSKEVVGSLVLKEKIFCLEKIRGDLIKRVIDWQLAKRRSGSHKVKTISEVSGTGKKPFKQKGTGRARQGTLRAVHMRGGGNVGGPIVRSHAIDLPKKIRKIALCHSLSSKNYNKSLFIIDSYELDNIKTKNVKLFLDSLGNGSFCVVGDYLKYRNFLLSIKNIPKVTPLSQDFINVYDVIRHDYLVLTVQAIEVLYKKLENI